jgi:hypothetical protein
MNKNLILIVWSWTIVSILLQVVVAYDLSAVVWTVRGGVDFLIALTAVVPLTLAYLGFWDEHRGVKMFIIVSLFFSIDLLLIWAASIVHT